MSISTKVNEVEAAFSDQRKLMEKRKLLGHMLGLLKAADKIEHIQRSEEAKNGQVLFVIVYLTFTATAIFCCLDFRRLKELLVNSINFNITQPFAKDCLYLHKSGRYSFFYQYFHTETNF